MRLLRLAGIVSLVLAGLTGTALAQEAPTVEAEFTCDGGKSVHAAFYPGRVDLRLSDGRTVELPQTPSAGGARYANADETLVFWNKGNTAFITEGTGGDETYSNCLTEAQPASAPAPAPTVEAEFTCDGDKSVHAAFYPERVDLSLGDGRTVELPQTISASGARYANADETLVFWNKGNTAFITEGTGGDETYSNCVTETK